MSDKNISERLKALATGKNRSATARLRERFDEIDVALRAGARRRDVYQALKEDGIAITFESFELAIYRLRKERGDARKHTMRSTPGVVALSVMVAPDATAPKTVQELMDDKPFEFPSKKKLIKPEGV